MSPLHQLVLFKKSCCLVLSAHLSFFTMKSIKSNLFVLFLASFLMALPGCGSGGSSDLDNTLQSLSNSQNHAFIPYFPESEIIYQGNDSFGGIAHTSFFNIISVGTSPDKPVNGQEVIVTAEVAIPIEKQDEENHIIAARLFHRVGTATANSPMNITVNATNKAATLTGKFTAKQGGNELFIWLKDQYGNVTAQAPSVTLPFPTNLDSSPLFTNQLIPGGSDQDQTDDIVPAEMDLNEVKIGYDKDFIYVFSKTDGLVSGGTLDPPSINIYFTKFTNPDTDVGEGLLIGKGIVYSPLTKHMTTSETLFPKEAVFLWDIQASFENKDAAFVTNRGERAIVINSGILSRTPISTVLSPNPSLTAHIIPMTIANRSLEALVPIPYNAAPFTVLHRYTTKVMVP